MIIMILDLGRMISIIVKVNITWLRLRVMRLKLNIIFSGVIVILAYKSTTAFRFTSWLLSVMNKGIKD